MTNVKPRRRVFVGLSGGVDSSVSAVLLKEQNYDVTGVYIMGWQPDFLTCTAEDDKRDAMRVCAKLGIPFRCLDLSLEYKKLVADVFIEEYRAGRTPNPDILCNREIKFGRFLSWALLNGADFVATGHYASVGKSDSGNYELLRSKDAEKDQTYFLWMLKQPQLAALLFPVGRFFEIRSTREGERLRAAYFNKKRQPRGLFRRQFCHEEFS